MLRTGTLCLSCASKTLQPRLLNHTTVEKVSAFILNRAERASQERIYMWAVMHYFRMLCLHLEIALHPIIAICANFPEASLDQ